MWIGSIGNEAPVNDDLRSSWKSMPCALSLATPIGSRFHGSTREMLAAGRQRVDDPHSCPTGRGRNLDGPARAEGLGLLAKGSNHPPAELTVAEGVTDIMRFVVGVHHLRPGEQFSHEMTFQRVEYLRLKLRNRHDCYGWP